MFALLFLAGQLAACRELQAAGYYAAGNPANAFFYVLTDAARPAPRRRPGRVDGDDGGMSATARSRSKRRGSRVEMCTVYWHYLLVVWLVLFGLLLAT